MNLSSPNFVFISFALFPLACSDPPSPPAQGAVAETISTAPGAQSACQGSSAPFTAPANTDPVNGTYQTLNCDTSMPGCKPNANVAVDGDNASVTCTVSGGGDSFSVNGVLSTTTVGFSVQSKAPFGAAGGKAFVSSSHDQHSLQDPDCDITVLPNKGEIKPGAIWATFNCPKFGDPSTGEFTCVASGQFLFENCSK